MDKKEDGALGQIVMVFEDSVASRFFQERKAVFKYLDDDQLPVEISIYVNTSQSGIKIDTKRESLDLVYRDNSQEEFTYSFHKGDKILVQVKDNRPWLTSINRVSSVYNDNLELLRNYEFYGKSYSKAQDFYLLWNDVKFLSGQLEMDDDLDRFKKESIQGLINELNWIDSLENEGLISEQTKAFYAAKNRMEQKKLEAFDLKAMVFNASVAINSFLDLNGSQSTYSVNLDEFSDLIIVNLTQEELKEVVDSLILGGVKNFQEKTLLFKYLQREIPYMSFEEADEILREYGTKLANPALLVSLNSSKGTLLNLEPDIEMMGLDNSFSTFEVLLRQKKGKYLYVDLWAAWCIPCIKAFPASIALNETYKNRGIEVIFLSIDDNIKYWEEVATKYEIAIPEQSFVAMKKEESSFLEALNIALIPRYIIFDPDGKLIHPNAPRPGSDEIKLFLDKITKPS